MLIIQFIAPLTACTVWPNKFYEGKKSVSKMLPRKADKEFYIISQ